MVSKFSTLVETYIEWFDTFPANNQLTTGRPSRIIRFSVVSLLVWFGRCLAHSEDDKSQWRSQSEVGLVGVRDSTVWQL